MKYIAAAATLALSCTAPAMAQACSAETPCEVADGEYYIALPESVAGAPMPALVYLHGFGGTGAGVFGNRGLVDAVLARGYAFVAPAGMMMEGRNGASWSFHPNLPQRRDTPTTKASRPPSPSNPKCAAARLWITPPAAASWST